MDLNICLVATAPTVYGIETSVSSLPVSGILERLQQHLPFTVLKLSLDTSTFTSPADLVATAPTVYGIETLQTMELLAPLPQVATAPTVYGIETI